MIEEKYKFHEYSSLFPNLEGDEFEALVEDIKEHGQIEPIILYNNEILDGKNRYKACEKLGKKPIFRKYSNGVKPIDFVISENIKRRHLDKGQIALILDEVVKIKVAERKREIAEAKKKAEAEQKRLKELEEKKKRELEAKKKRELEKAKTDAEKKKIAEKIEKEEKMLLKSTAQKKVNIPKPTTYKAESAKIAKESKVSTGYIRRAKELKEMAENEPQETDIIKKKVEEVKKGKKSLEKAYTEAKMIKDKVVVAKEDIDEKIIKKTMDIWLKISQEFRVDNIQEYSKRTQDKCVDIWQQAHKFILTEIDKYGKKYLNSKT